MESGFNHSRRSEQLREIIEERIATGQYAPGMRLDETELANEFEVSRTPIREALMQLASRGLIDMRPRRGATVAEISPQQLCEMFEVMAELEAMCGRLAARRMTEDEQQTLLEAHKACEEARDRANLDDYYRKNEQFHFAIYFASHNKFLIEEVIALHRRLSAYRRLQLRVRDRLRSSFSEHSGIIEAIIAGDGELAGDLLRKHITIQSERFADLIASLPSLGVAGDARAS
ncbi:MAG: GntR family transcriptional regulator [Deltaproteobacteria bacterium]|nr:GntR family transcriptional regulator [Deltaproteobacteria bacterium]